MSRGLSAVPGRLIGPCAWAGGAAVRVSRAAQSAIVAAGNGRSLQFDPGMEGLLCRQFAGRPEGRSTLLV
jgi:hypothetical protein